MMWQKRKEKGIYGGIVKGRLQGVVGEWMCREKGGLHFGLMMISLTGTRKAREGAGGRKVRRR